MNIDILVENASIFITTASTTTSSRSNTANISTDGSVSVEVSSSQLSDNTTTPYISTDTSSWSTGNLSPMAVHFLAVGALFAAVVVLAVVNAYLHFRSQRRRRLFAAAPPPAERNYSQRRRPRRGASAAAHEQPTAQSRPRMTMRMKPTKMFTG